MVTGEYTDLFLPISNWSHIQFRFGIFDNWPHSAGGVYVSINDLPHDTCFLQVNVIYYTVMPGPTEPNELQLCHVLENATTQVMRLKQGITLN